MRENLRRDCSNIWVIDCTPDGHQPEVATRIFQGVQQPVCIVLAARASNKDRNNPALLKFTSLPEGKRKTKFEALAELSLSGVYWVDGPSGWRDPFLAESGAVWADFAPLQSLFAWSGSGVTPHRVWPIAPDVHTLERRWSILTKETDVGRKELLFHSDSDRTPIRKV